MIVRLTYYVFTGIMAFAIALGIAYLAHLSYPWIAGITIALTIYLLRSHPAPLDHANQPVPVMLESIRSQYNLPALAGAIFTVDGITEIGATGVRKVGTTVTVTIDDLWHLGSDTKAMTATLAGTYVTEKKLSWDDKVISFFPDLANRVPEAMRNITVSQVLSHQAGLIENLKWRELSKNGSLSEQRLKAVEMALTATRLSSRKISLLQHQLCRDRRHPRGNWRQAVGGVDA